MQRVYVNEGSKKVPSSSPGQVDFLARLVISCKAYLPWADPGIFYWGRRGDPHIKILLVKDAPLKHPPLVLGKKVCTDFVNINVKIMM